MPLFRYHALGAEGEKVKGVIDADGIASAKEKLLAQKILVTSVEPIKEKESSKRLSGTMVLDFTRSLGQLLGAGLPLYESLQTIEEKHRTHRTHPLFLDLCDQLQAGSPFSTALLRHSESFDSVYISMVKAAEQTGSLPQIFEKLSLFLTRRQKIQKQLKTAMIYPAFLGGFCLIVVLILLLVVIPTMSPLFEGRPLHPITAIVLSLSQFLIQNRFLLSAITLFSLVGASVWIRRPQAKKWVQTFILHIPFVKTVALQSALIRFTRTFGILLGGGIPLLDALKLSKKVTNYSLFESIFENAEKDVLEGKSLSHSLQASPLIPQLVTRMVSIAEETGRMGPMMHHVADIYEDELEKNLQQLTTLLQPALLLLLGFIIGIVLLSVLIPLTDTSALS